MDNPLPRTLKEIASPSSVQLPLCIVFPGGQPFELKGGLIALLPKFGGEGTEDPFRHLQEFEMVCSSMRPNNATEEQATGISKDICAIRQYFRETLYEYWERFQKLCQSCPPYLISEELLIHYFYGGLEISAKLHLDASSGGVLVDKTPDEARKLITKIAANSRQFGDRQEHVKKPSVNELSTQSQGSRKLPSQAEVNPKENASAVTLRSGKELKDLHSKAKSKIENGGEGEKGEKDEILEANDENLEDEIEIEEEKVDEGKNASEQEEVP
ncbi:hypothetical protein POM88_035830 [Heracleum sosnowskyi]|uniref:Retrotransposon gag domain-containing protein n=1 Tax=Heracleum sosnowskyi TaxID=360622 RepID=A0AAD8MF22_9APIA|nr:hypothetical protein POM88_035830 [Heracleum sosnowskyi]